MSVKLYDNILLTQLYYYLDCFVISFCTLFAVFNNISLTYNYTLIIIIQMFCHIMLCMIFTLHIHVFNITDFI